MDNLRSIQNKGIDLRCAIEERVRQLRPLGSSPAPLPAGYVPSAGAAMSSNNINTNGHHHHGDGSSSVAAIGHQIGHVLKVGKHRLLSTAGLLDETTDGAYSDRVRAATQSKSLLLQIENEFKAVIGAVEALSGHYDCLLGLLEKFRGTCDDQLARDADAEAVEEWEAEQALGATTNGGGGGRGDGPLGMTNAVDIDDDFVVIADPPAPTAAVAPRSGVSGSLNSTINGSGSNGQNPPPLAGGGGGGSAGRKQRYRITAVDAELAALRRTLVKASADLKEGLRTSCHPISLSTRDELDATQTAIIADVTAKKTTYDLTRHKAQSRGMLLFEAPTNTSNSANVADSSGGGGAHVTASQAFVNQLATAQRLGDNNNSHQHQHQMWASDATVDGTVISLPRDATASDIQLRSDLLAHKAAYDGAVTEAKRRLHFALEQTSMSTWACYNVFFQQMATYYGEALGGNAALAKVLVALKNQQAIAVQLTAERKARSDRRAAEARKASEGATASGGGPVGMGGGYPHSIIMGNMGGNALEGPPSYASPHGQAAMAAARANKAHHHSPAPAAAVHASANNNYASPLNSFSNVAVAGSSTASVSANNAKAADLLDDLFGGPCTSHSSPAPASSPPAANYARASTGATANDDDEDFGDFLTASQKQQQQQQQPTPISAPFQHQQQQQHFSQPHNQESNNHSDPFNDAPDVPSSGFGFQASPQPLPQTQQTHVHVSAAGGGFAGPQMFANSVNTSATSSKMSLSSDVRKVDWDNMFE